MDLEVTVGEETFLDWFQRVEVDSTKVGLAEANFRQLIVSIEVEKEVCGLSQQLGGLCGYLFPCFLQSPLLILLHGTHLEFMKPINSLLR